MGQHASRGRPALSWALADAFVVAKRQITQIPRIPDELITATLQPAIVVLLFRYIIGGAIAIPGVSYVNYLMAGVFVQSAIFGSASTGVGVANDLQRGLIDRFRSLPMVQPARRFGPLAGTRLVRWPAHRPHSPGRLGLWMPHGAMRRRAASRSLKKDSSWKNC